MFTGTIFAGNVFISVGTLQNFQTRARDQKLVSEVTMFTGSKMVSLFEVLIGGALKSIQLQFDIYKVFNHSLKFNKYSLDYPIYTNCNESLSSHLAFPTLNIDWPQNQQDIPQG